MEYPSEWPVRIYTVAQLTSRIRDAIYRQFRDVVVEGEVSNFKVYPSGHLYFTLKDDSASLKAVMFNYYGKYPDGLIKDGTAVICRGRVDVYEKRGEYRLLADEIEVKGQGLLQIKFELLKEKLYKEGLFDATRKRPLPLLPRRIGIITSPVGAAIRDMLKIVFGKFENMDVRIFPVRVQGDRACDEVVAAIEHFNLERDVDVIILGRGGGSYEDLACFNEEAVARAIFASAIPIVSGIGHEIDITIADFVADVRAPTPTAAADMVVRDKRELSEMLRGMEQRLGHLMTKRLEASKLLLYKNLLELKEKKDFVVKYKMYLDELSNTLQYSFSTLLNNRKTKLKGCIQRLEDLNPENILKRGYSITVRSDTRAVVTEAGQVRKGDEVSVRLYRGSIGCVVEKKTETN
ncbi:MAG: Exodeoxyribonuclease 7 large subunit [Syntrophorhabdaceae bacterium PtaU1.Bin034]|jgi:exodeoxyribonuclease VII large subunit|nr:MAG: Exodeoxyribonuclease 7 large subunit [Syntrophorhabdaceae bacterium PtaU1.Bin034]